MKITPELISRIEKENSMEDQWLWYLAGTFDTAGLLSVKIRKDDSFAVDHEFRPMLTLSRPESRSKVLGMMEEYCEEKNVFYRIEDKKNQNSFRFIIDDSESIERFLKPIAGGFVQQKKQVDVMLTEIIPDVEKEEHHTKKGFFDLINHVETLRETSIKGSSSKYTKEYFENEWDLE